MSEVATKSVQTRTNSGGTHPFAWFCLEIWKERDGRDRVAEQWLDRTAIDVPADIVTEAGERLRTKRAG